MLSSNRTNGDKKELKEEKQGGAHGQGLRNQAGTAISLLEIKIPGEPPVQRRERERGAAHTRSLSPDSHTEPSGPSEPAGLGGGEPSAGLQAGPGQSQRRGATQVWSVPTATHVAHAHGLRE